MPEESFNATLKLVVTESATPRDLFALEQPVRGVVMRWPVPFRDLSSVRIDNGVQIAKQKMMMQGPEPQLPPPDPDPDPISFPEPNPDEPGPDVVPQIDPDPPGPKRF